jgi:hypothetical protein
MPSEKARTVTQLIKMPGVIEEAILALKGRQAVVTLGAFVAARDLAIALNLLDKSAIIPEGVLIALTGKVEQRSSKRHGRAVSYYFRYVHPSSK